MVGGLVHNLINITDTVFLGRVGTVELGAGGIASLWYFTFGMVGLGLGAGTQIMVARRLGEGRVAEVGPVMNNALLICLAASAFLYVCLEWGARLVFPRVLESQAVIDASYEYLRWRNLEILPALLSGVLRGFYTGLARNKVLVWSSVVMALVNVVLNYGLIFGRLGMPEMGIAGAGLASLLAAMTAFVMLGWELWRGGYVGQYALGLRGAWRPDVSRRLLTLSTPIFLRQMISLGSFFLFMGFIERLGEDALAASNVLKGVYILLMVPGWGFESAASTLVSNQQGQGNHVGVLRTLWRALTLNLAAAGLLILLFALLSEQLYWLFTDKPALIALAVQVSPILYVGLGIYAFVAILMGTVMGLGATRLVFLAEALTLIAYLLYAAWASAQPDATLVSIWLSEWIYMGVLGLPCALYLRFGKWRSLQI
jgi:putative MATE family efflux protein